MSESASGIAAVATGATPAPKPAAKYSEDAVRIVKDYQDARTQLSALVRYIGFGLVGLYLALSNSSAPNVKTIVSNNMAALLIIVLCGSLVIIFDYITMFCRTQSLSNLLDLIDRDDSRLRRSDDGKHYLYDPNDSYYRNSHRAFYAKQAFLVIGCTILVVVFAREIARLYSGQ
jgi:hypothetical protein